MARLQNSIYFLLRYKVRYIKSSSHCLLTVIPFIVQCFSLKFEFRHQKLPTFGADEFLAMLEGKIREAPFFKGSIW